MADNCAACNALEFARFELEKLVSKLELDGFDGGWLELPDELIALELRLAFSEMPPMEEPLDDFGRCAVFVEFIFVEFVEFTFA